MREETFGERLSGILNQKHMTQRELAERAGITQVSLSRYVNGSRTPRGPVVARIAKVLEVSSDYLLTGKEEEADKYANDYERIHGMIARSNISVEQRNKLINDLLNTPTYDN